MQSSRIVSRRRWAGISLLLLMAFRAHVPAGFMPANGAFFLLELCPAQLSGMPSHLHHHSGSHPGFEACPFGSTASAGPITHTIEFESAGLASFGPLASIAAPRLVFRAVRAHQPRGPPFPA